MTSPTVSSTIAEEGGTSAPVSAGWVRRAHDLCRSSITLSERSGIDPAEELLAQLDGGSARLDPVDLRRIASCLERAGIVLPRNASSVDVGLKQKSLRRVVDDSHATAHRPDASRSLPAEWRVSMGEDGPRVEDAVGREAGAFSVVGRAIAIQPSVHLARAGRVSVADVKARFLAASTSGRA